MVLEKHSTCGGACHTFTEEGYEFDVGIHYIGGFTRQTITHTLLDQISDGQIQWAQLGKDIVFFMEIVFEFFIYFRKQLRPCNFRRNVSNAT